MTNASTIHFARHLSVRIVPGDAVYVLSERTGQFRLAGNAAQGVAELLDGTHTRTDVVSELSDRFAAERIEKVLDTLLASGHVVESSTAVDPREAGYWESSGLPGARAAAAVRSTHVRVIDLGRTRTPSLESVLALAGLSTSGSEHEYESAVTLVITDDFLDPALAQINREHIAQNKAWMPVKIIGEVLWIGPILEPGHTACWECLRNRLASNQMVHQYIGGRLHSADLMTSVSDLAVTRTLGATYAALALTRWAAGATDGLGTERILRTIDTTTGGSWEHRLVRRPQCRECGDPTLQRALHEAPVRFAAVPKLHTVDGGHRSRSPEDLVARFEPYVSSITGAIKQLVKVETTVDGLHTYIAGQNFAVPMSDIGDLRAGLRSAAAGKGMSDAQAKASAIGEAVERYSGLYQGDEARIRSSYQKLGDAALHPNAIHLYSETQFDERERWNAKRVHFQFVTDRFDPHAQIDWTPVWSLTENRTRYVPTATLFYGFPLELGKCFTGADSNGNAAGSCLEDAALQGFMELVERDSVAIWWYNRLRRPSIDLTTFGQPYFAQWQAKYAAVNRETWILDVTTDLSIPSVVAVSRRTDKPCEDILIAFGAHWDVEVAIARAMTEMNQFLPAVIDAADGDEQYRFDDPEQHRWWQNATLESEYYLRPADDCVRTAADFVDLSTDDLGQDLDLARRVVEAAGMEMLVIDQTRPDIGLPVAKVIVPGMRHFWTRFAPGRLYDVPVQMGWLTDPTPERDLNPIAMFL